MQNRKVYGYMLFLNDIFADSQKFFIQNIDREIDMEEV